MSHERFNNWLCTVLFGVGIVAFAALGHMAVTNTVIFTEMLAAPSEMPANAYTNPGPYPESQRTWADLFAACRFHDAWLGSDVDGEPKCYPMGQREEAR